MCKVVERPSRMTGSGREALSDIREWSEVPSGCQGVVGRPSRISWSGREAILNVWERSGDLPDLRE